MKKQYSILLSLIVINCFIVSILSKYNVKVQSWAGNAIGAFAFLLPIQILLFLLGQDQNFANKKRTYFKVAFWFVNICYILGGIASLVQL